MALALHTLGNVVLEQGDSTGARALYKESLALRRELGDQGGIASVPILFTGLFLAVSVLFILLQIPLGVAYLQAGAPDRPPCTP
jgi:hypothetical protein